MPRRKKRRSGHRPERYHYTFPPKTKPSSAPETAEEVSVEKTPEAPALQEKAPSRLLSTTRDLAKATAHHAKQSFGKLRTTPKPSMSSVGTWFNNQIEWFKNDYTEFRKDKKKWIKDFVRAHSFVLTGIAIATILFWFFILRDLPTPNSLRSYENVPLATKIYDRNNELLYEIFSDENRTLVTLDQVPEHLKQATVAIEDKDFYEHSGINPIGGMLRAVKSSIEKGRLEGGSTITQQLIKSALLTPERTIQRKVKEIILATWAELIYKKDEILEMYLNQVPYGGTAWGIQAAADKYFNKSPKELTLAESALLAGLPQSPTQYSPFGAHPEFAIARQHQVLRRMAEDGYITNEQAEAAKLEDLQYASPSANIKAPHFVLYVKDLLVEKYGEKMVEQGGLKVVTTLDYDIQQSAEKHVFDEITKLENLRVGNGASLVTRPPTGEILAMVGSYDYFREGWGNVNVALAHRQPGSSIKPINYAIGIENKKITPASVFWDTPTCFKVAGQKDYCPKNYDSAFHGPVQTRFALGNSYNIPAVKMLALNTLPTMVASASAFGLDTINDPAQYGLSLTLGGGEVTMIDMAEAFSIFANAGKRRDITAILKVEDKDGKILEEFTDPNLVKNVRENIPPASALLIDGPQVVSAETAFLISHMLLDNNARSAAFGSSSALVVPGRAVSVKTGTTNDLRDNWTIGYTPNFLTVTWVGNNDNTPMSRVASGVSGASPIWNRIMRDILENQEDTWPKQPDGVVGRYICMPSGLAPASEGACANGRYEYFIKGTEPRVENLAKQQLFIDKTTGDVAREGQTENVEQQERTMLSDVYGTSRCIDCAIASPSSETDANTN